MTNEQENKLKEIKPKLSLEQYDLLVQKIHKMSGFADATKKIDDLLNKDITKIKQVIAVIKSKNKKNNVVTDTNYQRISVFLDYAKKEFDMAQINKIIKELEEIKKMKIEDYKKELQHEIDGREKELNELKEELKKLGE